MSKRDVLAWLRRIAQLSAMGFVVWAAWRIREQWTGLPTEIHLWQILLAGLCLLIGNFILGATWGQVLRRLTDTHLPHRWLMRVFLASNLGRYMPGKVALPAIRIGALGQRGIGATTVATSIGLELVSWGATAGLIAFSLLSVFSREGFRAALGGEVSSGPWLAPILLLNFLVLVGALLRVDRQALPPFVLRTLGLTDSGPLLSPKVLIGHLLYWCTWWLHGVFLLAPLGAGANAAAAAFVLAPVVGFLALIAPAGAGVREAIVVAMATPVTGLANAVAISLLSRALSLGADLSSWLLAIALSPGQSDDCPPRP